MALADCTTALTVDDWIADVDLGACSSVGTPEQRARAIAAATELLYVASGRRFACHVHTVRPNRVAADCGCPPADVAAAIVLGGFGCGCDAGAEIVLPGPSTVLGITIDGVLLDPAAYAVFDERRLVRVDGRSWPCCQRLTTPDGDAGTWSIEYRHGSQPPESGRMAAAELACEIARSFVGDSNCRLPRRVQTITRQNVSMTVVDAQDFLDKGRIGLPMCDYFLSYFGAPSRTGRRARIASPDTLARSTVPPAP